MRFSIHVAERAFLGSVLLLGLAACGGTPETDTAPPGEPLGETKQAWSSYHYEDHQQMTYTAVNDATSGAQGYANTVLGLPSDANVWECGTDVVGSFTGNLCDFNRGVDKCGTDGRGGNEQYWDFMVNMGYANPKSQNFHFMRDTDPPAQTAYEACVESVRKIQKAGDTAVASWRLPAQGPDGLEGWHAMNAAAGIATHTIQDSFAPGHVVRYNYADFQDLCVCGECFGTGACMHGTGLMDEAAFGNPLHQWLVKGAIEATRQFLVGIVDEYKPNGDQRAIKKVLNNWFNCTSLRPGGLASNNNALSRASNVIDTFFVRDDGSVLYANWYQGLAGSWPAFQLAGQGPGTAPKDTPIATVTLKGKDLFVFFAANDNTIHWGWRDQDYDSVIWNMDMVPGTGWGAPGDAVQVVPGNSIAAVSSGPGAIDLFFTGTDNAIYWSHWSELCTRQPGAAAQKWCGWDAKPHKIWSGSVPPNAALSAVARRPDQLDVFFVGADGRPHDLACIDFGTTNSTCKENSFSKWDLVTPTPPRSAAPPSECESAPPGTPISAVARRPDMLDVFWADSLGNVCTAYYSEAANAWKSGLVAYWASATATPTKLTTKKGGYVTASARFHDGLDVFVVGTDGKMQSAWWCFNCDGNKWHPGSIGSTKDGTAPPGSRVAVAVRDSDHYDIALQVFDAANHTAAINHAYWYTGASGWTRETVWKAAEVLPVGGCKETAQACSSDGECCTTFCNNGSCDCKGVERSCSSNAECCANSCSDHACGG